MTTGQTLLTLAAMMFLSTILLNFYRVMAESGDDIESGQDGILATSIATSYMEIAQGLAFDEVTDTVNIPLTNILLLTSPTSLGKEHDGEDSLHNLNDFDDFHTKVYDKDAGATGRRYRTSFKVQYVSPGNIEQVSVSRTFLKRMDLTTWRISPPPIPGSRIDTLRLSLVMGYFHFD